MNDDSCKLSTSCQKNSSISQVNILADLRKQTGSEILSNNSEMVWLLADNANNPPALNLVESKHEP